MSHILSIINGAEPASARFIKLLTDQGIDFYDRPGYIYEIYFENSDYDLDKLEEQYGNAEEWVKRAEAKGVDTSKLKHNTSQHSEPEDIQIPQDYRVASPMHQSFESKLKLAFNIV